MDIDDILADLDDDNGTTAHLSSSSYNRGDSLLNTSATVLPSYTDTNSNKNDNSQFSTHNRSSIRPVEHRPDYNYQELITVWRNERMSPELLPYPGQLMTRILNNIENQIEKVEFISMGYDEDTTSVPLGKENKSKSRTAHLEDLETVDVFDRDNAAGSKEDDYLNNPEYKYNRDKKLPLLCMEAELERVKFVVRSFIRCRLSKIDKYMVYIRQNDTPTEEEQDNDEEDGIFADSQRESGNSSIHHKHPSKLVSSGLLSPAEYQYLIKHSEILLKYFNNTVLQHMPVSLQLINDTESTMNMVDEPDMEQFVFIFVRGNNDEVDQFDVHIQDLDEDVTLVTGGIYVMRYEVIRDLLTEGIVVLI